jgi:hypothetical protein
MRLPHDSLAGTIASGLILTILLILAVKLVDGS